LIFAYFLATQRFLNEIEYYPLECIELSKLNEHMEINPRPVATLVDSDDSIWDSDTEGPEELPVWMVGITNQASTVTVKELDDAIIESIQEEKEEEVVIQMESIDNVVESEPATDDHPLILRSISTPLESTPPNIISLLNDPLLNASAGKRASILDIPQPLDLMDSPPDLNLAPPLSSKISKRRSGAPSISNKDISLAGPDLNVALSWFRPLKSWAENMGDSIGEVLMNPPILPRSEYTVRNTRETKRASFYLPIDEDGVPDSPVLHDTIEVVRRALFDDGPVIQRIEIERQRKGSKNKRASNQLLQLANVVDSVIDNYLGGVLEADKKER
jgi:hypothetical protein